MESNKQHGVLYSFLLLFLFVACFSGTVEAGVNLKGYTDNSNAYQYVLFGRYPQLQVPDIPLQPIVWRVLSADQAGTSRKGLLLSDKNLDASSFDVSLNNYGLSGIRSFLVGTEAGQFYNSAYFTNQEKGIVLPQSFTTTDGIGAGPVTTADNAMFLLSESEVKEPKYGFANGMGPDSTRIVLNTAYVQGKHISDLNGVGFWWTRSPVAPTSDDAWYVDNNGGLLDLSVYMTDYAVRPACLLNLESLIFKSASDDFDLASPSVSAAGSILNPYILVLSGDMPNGLPVKFASADRSPDGAVINGKTLTVSWHVPLTPAVKKWPAPGDFTLQPGGTHPTAVTSDNANPKILKLTFPTAVAYGAAVTLSYNLNTDAISTDYSAGTATATVVASFSNLSVTNQTPAPAPAPAPDDKPGSPSAPGVTPTQARYDGLSTADLNVLLGGVALSAANAGNLGITVSTPNGKRIPLAAGDYSVLGRNLTIFKAFLSKLSNGTHTLYLYNGSAQVGKITLTVTNSTASGTSVQGSGSSGCNAGLGLFGLGAVLAGLCKVAARKKK